MASLKQARAASLQAREQLLKFDGVLGVGYGPRERRGKLTDQPAVIVLVERKLPLSRLRKGQVLPKTAQGVPVDVREPRLTDEQHRAFLEANRIPAEQAECNIDHFFLDDGAIHRRNLARLREQRGRDDVAPGDAPRDLTTAVFGEIFVIEDDGTLVTGTTVDHVAAYQALRAEFGDDYDFVFFHYDTASGIPGQGNSSPTVHNTITGINHYRGDSYNGRAPWGTTKLQSYQKVTGLSQVRRMLHETAHRWCAYANHREGGTTSENLHEENANTTQKPFHWGSWFDNDRSCMDYDLADWVDSTLVPGEFQQVPLAAGVPGTDQFGFHELDLYLMGLMAPAEAGSFRYIHSPADSDGNGSFAGTQVNLTVADVVAEEGARNPAYPATQRVFHQAFVLITADLSGIGTLGDTGTVLGNFERYRRGLVEAFRRETGSRAMLDGSLLRAGYDQLYVRDNPADTGGPSSTGAFWNSPDIWVRRADDDGTAHQDPVRGDPNHIRVRVWNDAGAAYDAVTVRVYRANFAGTEFLYPDDWHPDELVGEDVVTVPAGGSAVARIPWPAALIPDETWHPCLLAEVVPMEVTPDQRHNVWDNRKLAQKNLTIVPAPGDAPVRFDFVLGHPARPDRREALLTVARTVDWPGLELLLDTGGVEVDLVERDELLPDRGYLPGPAAQPVPGGPPAGGLSVTLAGDATFLVGGQACGDAEAGGLRVTLCRGSRIVLESLGARESSPDQLVRLYRDGRLLYRLPRRGQLLLRVPTAGLGRVALRLHAELAGVPPGARNAFVQLVQSESSGQVVGGVDLLLRP